MARLTRKAVAKAIKDKFGDTVELVQGNGYLYFWNDELAGSGVSTSVSVCWLNHLTLDEWLKEYQTIKLGMITRQTNEAAAYNEFLAKIL